MHRRAHRSRSERWLAERAPVCAPTSEHGQTHTPAAACGNRRRLIRRRGFSYRDPTLDTRYNRRPRPGARQIRLLVGLCSPKFGCGPQQQAGIVIADTERQVGQSIGPALTHAEVESLRQWWPEHRSASHSPVGGPDEQQTSSPPAIPADNGADLMGVSAAAGGSVE